MLRNVPNLHSLIEKTNPSCLFARFTHYYENTFQSTLAACLRHRVHFAYLRCADTAYSTNEADRADCTHYANGSNRAYAYCSNRADSTYDHGSHHAPSAH